MKTLLLMRHAKSSWKDSEKADIDRPLSKRGKKDAPFMGKLLEEKDLVPELILSSVAKRARLTTEAVTKESNYQKKTVYLDSFYLAEPQEYMKELNSLPNKFDRVMIIGHNPGLEGLLQILSGRVESLPTAAIAHLSLPIKKWKELNSKTKGELLSLWFPRELRKKSKK